MKNENKTYQSLWYTAKAVLRGIFITTNAYMRKEEKSQTKNLSAHPQEAFLKKQHKINPKQAEVRV